MASLFPRRRGTFRHDVVEVWNRSAPLLCCRRVREHMILARRTFATLALARASSSRLRAFAPSYATSSPPSDAGQSAVTTPKAPPPPVVTRPSPPPKKAPSTASARPRPFKGEDYPSARGPSQRAAGRSRRKGKKKEIQRPLLEPYQLSNRLIALCERGDVDFAFKTLQRAPQNAQNIKVWNTLIQRFMIAKKYKLAYNVFTDVRYVSRSFFSWTHIQFSPVLLRGFFSFFLFNLG
jgi:hypothetical protein